jgi:alcohol dehydrogenase class IV
MVGQDRPLFDFEDREDWWTRACVGGMAPVVAVPTTSGTGSEVGRASVIIDEQDHSKKIIFHPGMLPGQVLCDPELTLGLPAGLTAATGMDALSHALEAWCAPGFHPMADGIALEAMHLVHSSLLRAVHDGQDIEARAQMMAASLMGATAFQKGLGAMHAIAHPVGALFDAHHGMINATVMPYVLEFNRSAIEPRLTRLATSLDLPGSGSQAVIDWVRSLRADLGVPEHLSALGPQASDIERLLPLVLQDPSCASNPVAMVKDEVESLLMACIEGSIDEPLFPRPRS